MSNGGLWTNAVGCQTIFEEKATNTHYNINDIPKFEAPPIEYPELDTLKKSRIIPGIKFPTGGRFDFIKLMKTGPDNMFPNVIHFDPLKLLKKKRRRRKGKGKGKGKGKK